MPAKNVILREQYCVCEIIGAGAFVKSETENVTNNLHKR
jgi:hypothetical protein